jgi:CDP-glycerol glycerophosphotransferase (TagB/SpsB family)
MKIKRLNPWHWIILLWTASVCILFLPFRIIYPKKHSKKRAILYGHKLHGNLHSIINITNRQIDRFEIYYLTLDPIYYFTLSKSKKNLLALNPFHLVKVVLCDCIITDHGLHSLILLKRFTNIKFIDVWHGIPFKGFTPEDFRLQHGYGEVWVSSQLLKSIYHEKFGFRGEQLYVTGYGRTDLILAYHQKKEQYRAKLQIPSDKSVILFAPTWKQDSKNREEIPFSLSPVQFITKLDQFAAEHNCVLIVRFHLNTSQKQSIKTENTLFMPLDDYPDSEMIVAVSDILITDWSSIAFDMMVLDKPIVFLDVPAPFKNGFSLPPSYRAGDTVRSCSELSKCLSQILSNEMSYMQKHWQRYQEIKHDVYDDTLDGKSAERYLKRLEEVLSSKD